jgi:hypothetical protein
MAGAKEKYVRPSFLGPHEGRELELMLAGRKHLCAFYEEIGIERETFPERQFDLHVAEGLFVKDIRIENGISRDGEEFSARSVLYATADEAWRVPAMRMIEDIYYSMGPGWRPDLERAKGSLLGYDRNDVERFIERLPGRSG